MKGVGGREVGVGDVGGPASLFLGPLERLLDSYHSGFAESEEPLSCLPETQLLGENNHRSQQHVPSRKGPKTAKQKRKIQGNKRDTVTHHTHICILISQNL